MVKTLPRGSDVEIECVAVLSNAKLCKKGFRNAAKVFE